MWVVVEKTPIGYRTKDARGRERTFRRIDGLWNYLKRAKVVYTQDPEGMTEYLKAKLNLSRIPFRIISTHSLLGRRLSVSDAQEILSVLEKEGFRIDVSSLGGLSAQLLYTFPESVRKLTEEEHRIGDEAFFGGRVENLVLDYTSERGDIVFYDINSAYPYLLAVLPVPKTFYQTGDSRGSLLEVFDEISLSDLRRLMEAGLTGIVQVEVEEDLYLPRLPVRAGEIFYPVGRISGYYHTGEIFYQFTERDRIRIKRAYLYRTVESPFRTVVYKMWKLREKYRDKKQVQKTIKLITNALWGVISKKGAVSNRIIGGRITAVQRVRLITKVRKLMNAGFKVLYYDTDGLLVDTAGRREEADRIMGLEKGKLGGWEVRHEGIKRFESGGVKQYRITFLDGTEEVVWKGIPKSEEISEIDVVSGKIRYKVRLSGWRGGGTAEEEVEVDTTPKRKFVSLDYSLPFHVREVLKYGNKDFKEKSVS